MFFLLRLTFWLGLVLVLLPREPAPQPTASSQFDAAEAISAATAAVSDMAQFCTRQPAACQAGGHAAAIIGERAQGGARKVYQFLMDQNDADKAGDRTGSIHHPPAGEAAGRDTLSAADRLIPRRAPSDPNIRQS